MAKKYVLKLTAEERTELEQLVKKGKAAGWKLQRAQALLRCDQGPDGPAWTDALAAAAYGCSTRSLESWRQQAVESGPLALLQRQPRRAPAVTPVLDGEQQARLTALACSQPKQLIAETRRPLPVAPGQPAHVDFAYVREGVCVVWLFVEALAGWRDVAVTATTTAADWAHRVQALVDDPRYAGAERITLVCDHLNTHTLAALYQAFGPAEALRLANQLELVHTPKHGSWLNVAESELSVLTRQCLDRRIDTEGEVAAEASAWKERRSAKQIGVEWQFTTADARIKLKHLYPKVKE